MSNERVEKVKRVVAWTVAIGAAGATLWAVGMTIATYWKCVSAGHVESLGWTEQIESAVEITLSISASLHEVSLITLLGVGALLFAKKGEARLVFTDFPGLTLALCCIVNLVAAILLYYWYAARLRLGMVSAAIAGVPLVPDFLSGSYLQISDRQWALMVLGIITGGFAFIAAHLRELRD